LRCPFCKDGESRVLDSRSLDNGFAIRRRRECGLCSRRFTTYERVEDVPLWVLKKDIWNRQQCYQQKTDQQQVPRPLPEHDIPPR
jgi:transcriptional regulator NrdR family protein